MHLAGRMVLSRLASLAAAIAVLLSLLLSPAVIAAPDGRGDVSTDVVIRLLPGVQPDALAVSTGGSVAEADAEAGTYLLRYKDRASAAGALNTLLGSAGVLNAEPNVVLEIPLAQVGLPGLDQVGLPGLDQVGLPGLDQVGLPGLDSDARARLSAGFESWRTQPAFDVIGVAAANQVATGQGVTVAFLDTGADQRHPLFNWLWAHAVPSGDYHGGWARTQLDLVGGSPSRDSRAHGTFVAGLIAGVAPGATLLSVRVADADGLSTSYLVAAGIRAAVKAGADVVNVSMSTPDRTPDVIRDAIDRATDVGVLVTASAGNDGRNSANFPARWAFSVGATDNADNRAQFSNYGGTVDLAAPGANVYSLYVANGQPATATWSGTSFSAAMTAGAAAVVADRYDERGEAARQRLENSADRVQSPAIFPYGRLDVAGAVGAR